VKVIFLLNTREKDGYNRGKERLEANQKKREGKKRREELKKNWFFGLGEKTLVKPKRGK